MSAFSQNEIILYILFCNQLHLVINFHNSLTVNVLAAPSPNCVFLTTPAPPGPVSKLACLLVVLESGYVLFTTASYLGAKFFISSKCKSQRQWDLNKDLILD